MFNYSSLNDVEFEELCKDIMERKLKTTLRVYSRGRDGGVDLGDNFVPQKNIVQVKHYIQSSFSSLRKSLENEVEKVAKKKPNQYYICVSKKLTNQNIQDIHLLFHDYMRSTENIITLNEIEEFLQKEENSDIVRKHFKLWLHSSEILSQMNNRNLFIDCESLFATIEEEKNLYVQTRIFDKSQVFLEKNKILMLIGAPGVGKTMTSKMLLLKMVDKGYRARYSTNGNISDIKKSLSVNSDLKEIILLDDCLGQYYFNLNQSIESELISLIDYVKMHPNKLLIMNSRITIYNEAKSRSLNFEYLDEGNKIKKYIINVNELSKFDKARILYNHFSAQKLPETYFKEIKRGEKYYNIIEHPNYTPRIIEYVTRKQFYLKLDPLNYYSEVINKLNYPDSIWEEEFIRRLTQIDRHFMYILYSLTDNFVNYDALRRCFEKRLLLINDLDTSIDHFELVIARLNGSMITLVDSNGRKQISVSNPSVNDYMHKNFYSNKLELENIRKTIIYFEQLKKCYPESSKANAVILKLVQTQEILNLSFKTFEEAALIITIFSVSSSIKKNAYRKYIHSFLINFNPEIAKSYGNEKIYKTIFSTLLENEDLYRFYEIETILKDYNSLKSCLLEIEINEIGSVINSLWKYLHKRKVMHLGNIKDYIKEIQNIVGEIVKSWLDDFQLLDVIDESDLESIVIEYADFDSSGEIDYDTYCIEEDLKELVKEFLYKEASYFFKNINFIEWDHVATIIDNSEIVDISGDDVLESLDISLEEDANIDLNEAKKINYDIKEKQSINDIDSIFQRKMDN